LDSAYWLVTFEEAESWINDGNLAQKRGLVETVINHCSQVIESQIHRQFVTRGSLTEYHSFDPAGADSELFTLEWPIVSVTSIHEDTNRGYGSDYLLTENTDYIVNKPKGKITRVHSASEGTRTWDLGFRSVKVIYTAGYADIASIPSDIKSVCLRYITEVYREVVRNMGNIVSTSDALGTVTRIGPAMLTSGMLRDLNPYRDDGRGFYSTGERDT
jgi:hypothetical protein